MDIQATLTLTIQAVIMSFVALMVFDFVDGLWVVPLPPAGWQPLQGEQPTVGAVATQPTCIAQQFEEIPDPWTLQTQSPHHSVPAPFVIVPFPRLRLLPPAQEVQPTKRTKAKSDTPRKSPTTKRQSTKSRKITA